MRSIFNLNEPSLILIHLWCVVTCWDCPVNDESRQCRARVNVWIQFRNYHTSSLFPVQPFLYVLFSARYYHPSVRFSFSPFWSKNIGASSIISVCYDGGYRWDGIGTASMKNCRCSWRHVKALLITFFWNTSVSPRWDGHCLGRLWKKILRSFDSCTMRVFIVVILSMFQFRPVKKESVIKRLKNYLSL